MSINIFEELPKDKIAQVNRFARDLAWLYVNQEVDQIIVDSYDDKIELHENPPPLIAYISGTWKNSPPSLQILRAMGYLAYFKLQYNNDQQYHIYNITEQAIHLLAKAPTSTTFISYHRSESSALALLIVARLKEHGLAAFLDVHPDNEGLQAGGNWHAELEGNIAKNDNFIVLIGPKTLGSKYVRQEIKWAQKYNKKIYTVWHNGYRGEEEGIPLADIEAMQPVIHKINAAIVDLENPKYYTAALYELLIPFGIVS